MSREEIQKLLGGYATDTLSEAERRALFEAALEDQELFDALAKEQALRDVLQEPSARQQLIEALGPANEPFAVRAWRWLRQPAALAMAGMAVLLIVSGLVLRQTKHQMRREVLMADAIATHPPVPSAVAPNAAPVKAMASPAVERKSKHLARLPAPTALPAQPELAPANMAAAPPPALPGASANGGLADTAEARRQMLQATQMPAPSFSARSGAPMAAMSRAKAVVSGAVKPAVEYTLLLKGADGAYAPVPSSTVFHAGDSLRIQAEPSEAGYISLFQRDGTGWTLVESRSVEKAQRYLLPTDGLQSDTPARLELLLVLSPVEHVDADALASQAQALSRITIEFR